MTKTMDRNGNSSDDDQSDGDQGIIELTDIIDESVDGYADTDQSTSTMMRDMVRDDGSLLSDDAIEAALLRIVEKKYARQLDTLFVEAVERVVEREIAAIKQGLLKDL